MRTPELAGASANTVSVRRLLLVLAATLGGGLACALLLVGLGGPVRLAYAAPLAPTVRPYPGSAPCNTSLQACVNGATPGDTIDIQPNTYITSVTLSQAVSLTGVSSATVILQALSGQRVLTVTGASINASVVISGITFRGGSAVGAGCPAGCGGAILITGTASPLLRGLVITNNTAQFQGGGLFAGIGSQVQFDAVSVLSNTSGSDGGGVRVSGAVTVTGGLFYNNRCTQTSCGAAGMYAGGALNMTGTRFISNTSLGGAGGLYAPLAAIINGGLFQDNRCTEDNCFGGGLYTNNTLALTGTQFLSNTSRLFGGGLYSANQLASLNGALFRNNQCTQSSCSGGGVRADALVLTNTQFISNSSTSAGGGVLALSPLTAVGSLFQANSCTGAACSGGGLSSSFGLTLTNSFVLSNTATGDGGGAYTSGPARLTGGVIQNNRCTGPTCIGGGLVAGAGLVLTGTQVISNSSGHDGGGIRAIGPVTLTGGLFERNSCTQTACGAGGLYAGGALSMTGTQFISNTTLGGASGLYAPFAANITGGLFQENRCTEDTCEGAGLFTNNSLVLTGTQFLSNTSRSRGGGLYANDTVTLTNAIFRNNQCTAAACEGGAIFALDGLTIRGGQIISNSAVGYGGGWVVDLALVVSNTQVLSNTAGVKGGGGLAGSSVTLTGSLFRNNRCTQSACNGGALYGDAPMVITGTQFLSNTSLFDGGALYAGAAITLTNSLFQGNACTESFCYAGGLLANAAATVAGTRFWGNSSRSNGGGLYAAAALTVTGSEFRGNQSGEGGGLNHAGAAGLIVNSLFAGNQASSGHGAALALLSPGTTSLLHTTIVSATLGSGSAVYVNNHTALLTNTLVSGYAIGLERASGSLTEDYTLFSGVPAPYSGTISVGAHSFTGTAGFVNAPAGDFHLGPASDAIDAGAAAGVPVDFDGEPRPAAAANDIGFDEWYARLYLPQTLR